MITSQKNESKAFIHSVLEAERKVIADLDLENQLLAYVRTSSGLSRFASDFYFIRVNFVKLNFIVGARCPTHELYWSGLAHNLMEELGGQRGRTHNELYRWFLKEAGHPTEDGLLRPKFATDFDSKWKRYCRKAPLHGALGAIAVYEIFDNPDYQMLLNIMRKAGIEKRGLAFYQVHAKAAHFELFESFFNHTTKISGGKETLRKATDFVINAQRKMWKGLLDDLKSNAAPPH